tara:strand:+ start:482 stop:604 length:123 start_codon:yes stop_codon:yes gene_type:complete
MLAIPIGDIVPFFVSAWFPQAADQESGVWHLGFGGDDCPL